MLEWRCYVVGTCHGMLPKALQMRVYRVSRHAMACPNAVHLRNAHIVVGTCHGMSHKGIHTHRWPRRWYMRSATCHGMSLQLAVYQRIAWVGHVGDVPAVRSPMHGA